MTRRATEQAFFIFSNAATLPHLNVGPYIIEASSDTTPLSSGSPPYPTEESSGSSSHTLPPASIPSRIFPEAWKASHAGGSTFLAQASSRLHRINAFPAPDGV